MATSNVESTPDPYATLEGKGKDDYNCQVFSLLDKIA